MQNHCLALTNTPSCVTVHTGCPTGRPWELQRLRSVSAGLTRIGKRRRALRAADAGREERFVRAGVTYITFQTPPAAVQLPGGARHRRPGSRRSTSAWTAYVASARAAGGSDFPEARLQGSVQWLSSYLPGRRRHVPSGLPTGGAAVAQQASVALPGRPCLKSSVGGPHGLGARPGTGAGVARGCSPLRRRQHTSSGSGFGADLRVIGAEELHTPPKYGPSGRPASGGELNQ